MLLGVPLKWWTDLSVSVAALGINLPLGCDELGGPEVVAIGTTSWVSVWRLLIAIDSRVLLLLETELMLVAFEVGVSFDSLAELVVTWLLLGSPVLLLMHKRRLVVIHGGAGLPVLLVASSSTSTSSDILFELVDVLLDLDLNLLSVFMVWDAWILIFSCSTFDIWVLINSRASNWLKICRELLVIDALLVVPALLVLSLVKLHSRCLELVPIVRSLLKHCDSLL